MLHGVAIACLGFACEHPALHEAVFTMPIGLRFADAETKPELKAAFAALAAAVPPSGRSGSDDEAATETFWAALRGLAELERSRRIRQSACDTRVALLVEALLMVSQPVHDRSTDRQAS